MSTANRRLTARQLEVLRHLAQQREPVATGSDGSVLWALERRGLASQGQMSFPGYKAYYWYITPGGRGAVEFADRAAAANREWMAELDREAQARALKA